MYTAASMPGETGPVASASLGSAIENGGRERLGQLWHPASKCRTATERLSVCGAGRYQSRDGLASIRNCDFVPLSNLSNQCRQVLPGFTYSCFFHPAIVLHVALACNCPIGNVVSPEPGRAGHRALLPEYPQVSSRGCVRKPPLRCTATLFREAIPSRPGWLEPRGSVTTMSLPIRTV